MLSAGRQTPSVACAVQPGAPGGFQKVFFGSEEVAIPVFGRHALWTTGNCKCLTSTSMRITTDHRCACCCAPRDDHHGIEVANDPPLLAQHRGCREGAPQG